MFWYVKFYLLNKVYKKLETFLVSIRKKKPKYVLLQIFGIKILVLSP